MFFLFRYLMSKNSTSNKKLREISTGIYIFHPLFIVAIRFVSGIVGLEKIFVENNLILYLTVCLGTFLFTLLIQRGKGLFKNVKLELILLVTSILNFLISTILDKSNKN